MGSADWQLAVAGGHRASVLSLLPLHEHKLACVL